MNPGELWQESIAPHNIAMVLRVIDVPVFTVAGQDDTIQHVIFLSAKGETEVPIHWRYNFMERIDATG
jgi:hypothetical protein